MYYIIHELMRHGVTQKLIVSMFSEEKSHSVIHKNIGCVLNEYVVF